MAAGSPVQSGPALSTGSRPVSGCAVGRPAGRKRAVEEVEPTPGVQVPLDAGLSAYLRDSLASVVATGTAAEGFAGFPLAQWPVAGKTGSAESGHGNDVSWFISYAPADSPRYVVAVAITQAGLGSEAAVPVARAIHDELRRLG